MTEQSTGDPRGMDTKTEEGTAFLTRNRNRKGILPHFSPHTALTQPPERQCGGGNAAGTPWPDDCERPYDIRSPNNGRLEFLNDLQLLSRLAYTDSP